MYNVWPPFSKFCMKQFEFVVLDLLCRSMFSSGMRLSIEWSFLCLSEGRQECLFSLSSHFVRLWTREKVKATFSLFFNSLWSSTRPSHTRVFRELFFSCCLNRNSRIDSKNYCSGKFLLVILSLIFCFSLS